MRYFSFLLAFFLCWQCAAQSGTPPVAGARGLAMANASVAFSDINSIFSNQAGLAYLSNFSATVYGERRFELADLNQFGAGIAYPSSLGTFGLQLGYFGFDLYKEQKIGLAYGRKLMDKLSLGVQFDLINTRIQEYGSKTLLTFEIGLLSPITKELTIGVHLYSPVRVKLIDEEYLPTLVKVGLAYQASTKVILTTEVEKDIDLNPIVKAGIEYMVHPVLALRLGASSNPGLFSFGIGYNIKDQLQIDLASSYHQSLGFSPGLSVRYAVDKKR